MHASIRNLSLDRCCFDIWFSNIDMTTMFITLVCENIHGKISKLSKFFKCCKIVVKQFRGGNHLLLAVDSFLLSCYCLNLSQLLDRYVIVKSGRCIIYTTRLDCQSKVKLKFSCI